MKMNLIYMMIFIAGLWSCDKGMSPVVEPPEEEQEVFDLQWATRLDMDKEIVGTDNTQQYGDWVLVGGDIDAPPNVKAFNKETGTLDWEYVHEGVVNSEIDESSMINNVYVGICSDGIIALDVQNVELLWEINFDLFSYDRFSGSVVMGDYLYAKIIKDFQTTNQQVELIKIDVKNGDFENVLSFLGDYNNGISPSAFMEIEGRTIMMLNEYPIGGSAPPQETEQNIMAIDISNEEVLWRTENFTENFASNGGHPPILYDDLVITGGDWSIYAFDVHTGEQRWRFEFDYPWAIWNNTNHLIHGDRLYVNNGQEDVTCLNPRTGELIWNNPKGGANCTDNMIYYEKEDYLVFTSWGYGSVMVLDAITGETVHREHRYDDSQYNNDVVYDEELDMFFTSTYKHAVGFKINGD